MALLNQCHLLILFLLGTAAERPAATVDPCPQDDVLPKVDVPAERYPLLGVYIFRLIQIGISGKYMYDKDGHIHRHFAV